MLPKKKVGGKKKTSELGEEKMTRNDKQKKKFTFFHGHPQVVDFPNFDGFVVGVCEYVVCVNFFVFFLSFLPWFFFFITVVRWELVFLFFILISHSLSYFVFFLLPTQRGKKKRVDKISYPDSILRPFASYQFRQKKTKAIVLFCCYVVIMYI